MAFNGSGTFLPVASPNYPAVTGQSITAAHFNTFANDLMTNGLSLCMTRDGQGVWTGNQNAGTHLINNLGTPVVGTDAANKAYADLMLPLAGGTIANNLTVQGNYSSPGSFALTAAAATITFAGIVTFSGTVTLAGNPSSALQAAPKQYVDAVTTSLAAYAPLASPALTGNPTAPTAAQFDNDTSIATTAFVQRSVGNKSGYVQLVSSVTLTAADAGKIYQIQSGCTAVSLPLASGVIAGSTYKLQNVSGAPVAVSSSGSDVISVNGAGNITAVSLADGEYADFTLLGGVFWSCTGTAAIKYSNNFQAFLGAGATGGYQRLPSGLIMQWKQGTAMTTEVSQAITLPMAFPTSVLACTVTDICALADGNSDMIFQLKGYTNTTATVFLQGFTSGGSHVPQIFAIGY